MTPPLASVKSVNAPKIVIPAGIIIEARVPVFVQFLLESVIVENTVVDRQVMAHHIVPDIAAVVQTQSAPCSPKSGCEFIVTS
jgi:hypothetical protein